MKTRTFSIHAFKAGKSRQCEDQLATEQPLEVNVLQRSRDRHTVAVTMRTPGSDTELALGFLFSEGLLHRASDVIRSHLRGTPDQAQNSIDVHLQPTVDFDASRLQRHFYSNSSCGLCGKASLELLQQHSMYWPLPAVPQIQASVLLELPGRLRSQQQLFGLTGGIHAVGLFDAAGHLLCLREDVGRHNAMDKVLGWALQHDLLPLRQHTVLLSGRASFELLQKAYMAGVAVVAAVGAPSSLAVELARESNISLVGFLREQRFNVYHDADRIIGITETGCP